MFKRKTCASTTKYISNLLMLFCCVIILVFAVQSLLRIKSLGDNYYKFNTETRASESLISLLQDKSLQRVSVVGLANREPEADILLQYLLLPTKLSNQTTDLRYVIEFVNAQSVDIVADSDAIQSLTEDSDEVSDLDKQIIYSDLETDIFSIRLSEDTSKAVPVTIDIPAPAISFVSKPNKTNTDYLLYLVWLLLPIYAFYRLCLSVIQKTSPVMTDKTDSENKLNPSFYDNILCQLCSICAGIVFAQAVPAVIFLQTHYYLRGKADNYYWTAEAILFMIIIALAGAIYNYHKNSGNSFIVYYRLIIAAAFLFCFSSFYQASKISDENTTKTASTPDIVGNNNIKICESFTKAKIMAVSGNDWQNVLQAFNCPDSVVPIRNKQLSSWDLIISRYQLATGSQNIILAIYILVIETIAALIFSITFIFLSLYKMQFCFSGKNK